MSRASWKNIYIHRSLLKKTILQKKQLIVWKRNSAIHHSLVDKKLLVYCGKKSVMTYVKPLRVLYKIGEFCMTRGKFFHKNKLKVLKKNIKIKVKTKIKK